MSAAAQNADSNDTAAPQPQMQFMPFQQAGGFGCASVAVVCCPVFAQSALLAWLLTWLWVIPAQAMSAWCHPRQNARAAGWCIRQTEGIQGKSTKQLSFGVGSNTNVLCVCCCVVPCSCCSIRGHSRHSPPPAQGAPAAVRQHDDQPSTSRQVWFSRAPVSHG